MPREDGRPAAAECPRRPALGATGWRSKKVAVPLQDSGPVDVGLGLLRQTLRVTSALLYKLPLPVSVGLGAASDRLQGCGPGLGLPEFFSSHLLSPCMAIAPPHKATLVLTPNGTSPSVTLQPARSPRSLAFSPARGWRNTRLEGARAWHAC